MAMLLLLLATLFIAFFSASAVKCYVEGLLEGNEGLKARECEAGMTGCVIGQNCKSFKNFRACVRGPSDQICTTAKFAHLGGEIIRENCGKCIACSGTDLCNDNGLTDAEKEAAGGKPPAVNCYVGGFEGDEGLHARKCPAGMTGCVIGQNCKTFKNFRACARGSSHQICNTKHKALGGKTIREECQTCHFCSGTGLCNDQGLTEAEKEVAGGGGA